MILAQAFSRYVFDLDGVIWRMHEPIEGAPETLRSLRSAGKRICFVTNNSAATTERVAKLLVRAGVDASPDEVVTSALAAARLVQGSVPGLLGRLTFVIGGEGLVTAVSELGVRLVGVEEAPDASIVVVGVDWELTYEKLRVATLAIRRGATFVASNTDPTYPAADGFWPGAGSIVAALRTSTDVTPLVAGKPRPGIFALARERLGGSPALMVGDRVDTDVCGAQAVGWPAALVLTGATAVPDLAAAPAWPDYVLRRLPDLLEDRPHPEIRPAAGPDLPQIAAMLHAGGLVAGAARERLARTVVAEADRSVIATASWEVHDGAALLRSVAVAPALRGSGIGTLVVAAALRQILRSSTRDVYLVTQDAEIFFASCGFRSVERSALPRELAAHPQVARECATAPAMYLRLPAPQPHPS